MAKSYPWYTPYQFAGNKPIAFVDLDGLEEWYYMHTGIWFKSKSILGPLDEGILNSHGYYHVAQVNKINQEIQIATAKKEANDRQIRARQGQVDFVNHRAKMSNPLYVGYKLSMVGDAVDITTELAAGNTAAASVIAILTIIDQTDIAKNFIRTAGRSVRSYNPSSLNWTNLQKGYDISDARPLGRGYNTQELRSVNGNSIVALVDGGNAGLTYVKNSLISKHKLSARDVGNGSNMKPQPVWGNPGKDGDAFWYSKTDEFGNQYNLEFAPNGGGKEPPHVKFTIKNKNNEQIHFEKYFREQDKFSVTPN